MADRRLLRLRAIALLALGLATAAPALAQANGAEGPGALRDRATEIRARLDQSPFGRPLAIDSTAAEGALRGEVHALLAHPFAKVRSALAEPRAWCELLTLPFNMQKCEATDESLRLFVGRKPDSPIEEATRIDFRFEALPRADEALEVRLSAREGPAGTRDYRIAFAAIPADGGRTLVHMRYGYRHGAVTAMLMQAYLSTSGAGKVGFTADGLDDAGRPRLVTGLRGVIERNTMRYFLAIDAYLGCLDAPPAARRRARLEAWFDAADRYPRQLREMSKARYLEIKGG